MESNVEQNVIIKDINNSKIETFLSPYVKEMVTNLSISDIEIDGILNSDLCLNWDQVLQYMPKEISFDNNICEEMPKMVSNISPVINSVHRIYDKLLNEKSDHFIQLQTNAVYNESSGPEK